MCVRLSVNTHSLLHVHIFHNFHTTIIHATCIINTVPYVRYSVDINPALSPLACYTCQAVHVL